MSRYRQLNGLASNLADKFATSCEHFAELSAWFHEPIIMVDLMEEKISPERFTSYRTMSLVQMCSRDLRRHMEGIPPGTIVSAILTCTFGIEKNSGAIIPSISVAITDDRSKTWTRTVLRTR